MLVGLLRLRLPPARTLRKCRLACEIIRRRYRGPDVRPVAFRLICPRKAQASTIMEMHQVRYFLAVARYLNFSRAAEDCNVTQPSLSRAIQQLEAEFGGPLFHRERKFTHLTDLGQMVRPHLETVYSSALKAKRVSHDLNELSTVLLKL